MNFLSPTTNCRICGRPLIDSDDLRKGDPRTDLGGDCLACVYGVEKRMKVPRRVRCTRPRYADRDGERPRALVVRDDEQREQANELLRRGLAGG